MLESNKLERVLSIDVFRGLTMFLLIGEFTHLFSYMVDEQLEGTIAYYLGQQFHHHAWNGLRFWDLVQPFFMFIVGLSLPFAVNNRLKKGDSSRDILKHVIRRSLILLILGWALYCIGPGRITFRFQNVLAQIAFTYLIAYLIMNKSFRFQFAFSLGILIFTELIYRFFPVEGFNHPFTPNENFGTWFDLLYGGADLGGHWVSFNALPTTAHTVWGVLVGKLFMSDKSKQQKFNILALTGIVMVVAGYGMDFFMPIIKRISTSSFVVVSGGWSILTMAILFWIVDIKNLKGRWTLFFQVVGINSLFIYLFAHLDGASFVENIFHPFTYFIFSWGNELTIKILTSVTVWMALWSICYWMYKKRIFIKI